MWQRTNMARWGVIILVSCAGARTESKPESKPMTPPEPHLSLEARIRPTALPAARTIDLTIELELRNEGSGALTVFPEATQLRQASGWVGPWWDVTLVRNGKDQPNAVRELRTYYGPPAQPPNDQFWVSAKRVLRPGAKATARLTACWIPATKLKPQNLALSTLDPEGMDGLAQSALSLDGVHVLALGRSCADVEPDMKERPDFLRAGVVVFIPPGSAFSLRFGYAQEENVFFKATTLTSTPSECIELTIR